MTTPTISSRHPPDERDYRLRHQIPHRLARSRRSTRRRCWRWERYRRAAPAMAADETEGVPARAVFVGARAARASGASWTNMSSRKKRPERLCALNGRK
jgi:hypothetical protein